MNALIIMTRVPIPFRTKTRLMDFFSGQECSELQECFLLDIFNVCKNLKDHMDIYLTYTPEFATDDLREYTPYYINMFSQRGNNLGMRMKNSIDYLLQKGYEKVILIGSDIPEIKSDNILDAMKSLDDSDICIGPTFDGGYYLIGMKEPVRCIFDSYIKWGGRTVFDKTVEIARENNLFVSFAHRCRDIDTKEDIAGFLRDAVKCRDEEYPKNSYFYILNNQGDEFEEYLNDR